MARRVSVALAWLALGAAAACGRVEQPLGNLPAQKPEPDAAGASGRSGRQPTGTPEIAGESSGGASSPGQACAYPLPFQCLKDCYDMVGVGLICEDGEWACAPGSIAHTSCPPDTPGACWWKDKPTCYDSCESGMLVASDCVAGEPVCPKGTVQAQECPLESCISGANCCDPNGEGSQPKCDDATHQLEACPDGGRLNLGLCLPEGVTAKSCYELSGQECASAAYHCHGGCTTDCSCVPGASSSGLVWQCTQHPC